MELECVKNVGATTNTKCILGTFSNVTNLVVAVAIAIKIVVLSSNQQLLFPILAMELLVLL